MNGIQIEHVLNVIEDKSASNRGTIRREAAVYLRDNIVDVVNNLASDGETIIPTSYGGLKLTKADLELVTA